VRGPIGRKGFPAALTGKEARKYPRAELNVKAHLSMQGDRSRFFEATLPIANISVGGMFLESTFFVKVGTLLEVTLELPPHDRKVHVRAQVVRIETMTSNGVGKSGFALRFTEYLDGSEVVLATHFLAPVLREFTEEYVREHRIRADAKYLQQMADVLAAWELKKAEIGNDVWEIKPTASPSPRPSARRR
jgi:hypothetical protein